MLKWHHKTNTLMHTSASIGGMEIYIFNSCVVACSKQHIKGIGRHINCYLLATLTMVSFIFSFFFRFSPSTSAFHFSILFVALSLALCYVCAARFIQCFTLLYFKAKRIQTMPCRLCTHKIKQIIYNCMIFPLYTASTQTVFHSSSLLIFLWRFPHAFVHFSIFSCLSLIVNTQTAKLCKQMEENTKETGMSMGRDGNSEQTLLVTVPFLMLLFLNYKNH